MPMPTATYSSPSNQLTKYADDTNAYIRFYAFHPTRFSGGNTLGADHYLSADHSAQRAIFYAYVNDFDETFSSSWDAQQYYGKTDSIVGFKNTKRTISLSWKTPAMDLEAALFNYKNLNHLAMQLYPSYMGAIKTRFGTTSQNALSGGNSNSPNPAQQRAEQYLRQPASLPLGKPPIIGVSWGNLIKNRDDNHYYDYDPEDGPNPSYSFKLTALICHVENFALSPAIEAGFFSDGENLYPRVWTCSVALTVQHTHELGRQAKPW